ncbi:MAG: hypothetical protein WC683_00285 [bacterium]
MKPDVTRENYDRAREDIIATYGGLTGVRSIYEYGTCDDPGASDIDIILVIDDTTGIPTEIESIKSLLRRDTLKLIDDANIILIPRKNAESVLIWDDIKLGLLYGEEINFETYDQLYAQLEIARIIDWLPERLYRVFDILQGNIPAKKSVAILNSLNKSVKRVERLCSMEIKSKASFVKKIKGLRKAFQINVVPERTDILDCCNDALDVGHAALKGFIGALYDWNTYGGTYLNGERRAVIPGGGVCYFKPGASPALERNSGSMVMPCILLKHYELYARESGVVSEWIGRQIGSDREGSIEDIDNIHKEALRSRIRIANSWGEWFMRRGLRKGLFKYGWMFQN